MVFAFNKGKVPAVVQYFGQFYDARFKGHWQ